jgi:hypothetical protein
MSAFYLYTEDEHGISYTAETFHSVEDALSFIDALEDALEDATVGQYYAISAAIESLKDQLANYQELPE